MISVMNNIPTLISKITIENEYLDDNIFHCSPIVDRRFLFLSNTGDIYIYNIDSCEHRKIFNIIPYFNLHNVNDEKIILDYSYACCLSFYDSFISLMLTIKDKRYEFMFDLDKDFTRVIKFNKLNHLSTISIYRHKNMSRIIHYIPDDEIIEDSMNKYKVIINQYDPHNGNVEGLEIVSHGNGIMDTCTDFTSSMIYAIDDEKLSIIEMKEFILKEKILSDYNISIPKGEIVILLTVQNHPFIGIINNGLIYFINTRTYSLHSDKIILDGDIKSYQCYGSSSDTLLIYRNNTTYLAYVIYENNKLHLRQINLTLMGIPSNEKIRSITSDKNNYIIKSHKSLWVYKK